MNYLPWTAYATLAIAVWIIHVVERLHSAKRRDACGIPLGERHCFHLRHSACFLTVAAIASLGLLALVFVAMPISIFGYLTIGALLVVGYFIMSRLDHGPPRDIAYGRHFLAGAAYAYGIAMVAHVFLPAVGKHDLIISREFLTFFVLCVIHLSAIDFWEKSSRDVHSEEAASGELSLILPVMVLAVVALGFAISGHQQSVRPFYYAILTGAALIHVINRNRGKFNGEQLRVVADFGMLAPALVFHAYPPV